MSYPAFMASSNQQEFKTRKCSGKFSKKTKVTIHNKIWENIPPKMWGCIKSESGSLLHTDSSTKVLLAFFFPRLPKLSNQDVSGDDPLTRHILELPRILFFGCPELA